MTEALFKYLLGKREELKEEWATGRFVSPDPVASARDNALAHATTGVIKELLELDSLDLRENDE